MSYDIKCDALAEAFLSDHREQINGLDAPEMQRELAQRIQDAIEEYLTEKGLD